MATVIAKQDNVSFQSGNRSRKEVDYEATLEGMSKALDDLVAVRAPLALMGYELNAEETRVRNIVKKYAERNRLEGRNAEPAAIRETNKRIKELMSLLENSFELVISGAFDHFNRLVVMIREEDRSALKLIEVDLATFQSEFRAAQSDPNATYDDVAAAYARVNDFLVGTLERLSEEKRRAAEEELKSSIKQALDEL